MMITGLRYRSLMMANKLWSILGLCVVFSIVLMFIHSLAVQRDYYHSSALLGSLDYQMIIRSMKYGMVLVIMVFSAFFLSEVLQEWRIHPMQYLLIGLEDVVFYLLVLSLSEHMGFAISYAISAIAVSAIVFFYASAIFKGARWGIFITCVQLVSYAILYVILNSEDYALLMGSLMIFAVISLVMYFTRKLDWYDTAIPSGEKKQEQEPEI